LVEFPLFKGPQRLREMFLKPYPALLMALVHLRPPTLRRSRSPFPYIVNQYNTPALNRLHPIISLCIILNLPHLPISWSITIIIIQGLFIHIDHIHPGYIATHL